MDSTITRVLSDDARALRTAIFMDEQGFEHEFDDYDEPDRAIHLVLHDEIEPIATGRLYPSSGEKDASTPESRAELVHAVVVEDENPGTHDRVSSEPTGTYVDAHIIEESPQVRSGRVGNVTYMYASGDPNANVSVGSIFGTLAKRMVGLFLIMIGIPMLILPGPGLASIGVGLFLLFSPSRSAVTQGGSADGR